MPKAKTTTKPVGTEPAPLTERAAIDFLQANGFRIEKQLPHEPRLHFATPANKTVRWAIVSCTHLGGKFQQISALQDFCQRAYDAGVTEFWHAGDIVNGSSRRHDYIYENFIHGATAQTNYAAEHLPSFPGAKWRVIDGNHDEWWNTTEGFVVGEELALRRPDIEYVGRRSAWVQVDELGIYIHHGAGAMPYALTYKLQRAIERMNPRPDVYMIANWHSAVHAPGYGGTELLMTPCFQGLTPFERGKGLWPTVGGVILEMNYNDAGVWEVKPDWRIYKKHVDHDY